MTDPKLTGTAVDIRYTADDGYESEEGFRTETMQKPEAALLAALGEIARLLALFGFEKEAVREFNEALQRVHDWKEARTQAKESGP